MEDLSTGAAPMFIIVKDSRAGSGFAESV